MTCTVVVEIKYFCNKNVVTHTENCKLNLPLDCSTTQMDKNYEECVAQMNQVDEGDLQILQIQIPITNCQHHMYSSGVCQFWKKR